MLWYNYIKAATSMCFAKHCFHRRPTLVSGFLRVLKFQGKPRIIICVVISHLEFYFQSKGVNPQSFSINKFHLIYFCVSLLVRDHFKFNFYPTRQNMGTLLVFKLCKGVNSLSSVEEKSSSLHLNIITKESTLWCCVIPPGTKGKLGTWQVIIT